MTATPLLSVHRLSLRRGLVLIIGSCDTAIGVCDLQVELKPLDVPPSNLQTRH
jgi:hypothetical protein